MFESSNANPPLYMWTAWVKSVLLDTDPDLTRATPSNFTNFRTRHPVAYFS